MLLEHIKEETEESIDSRYTGGTTGKHFDKRRR